MHPRYQRNDNDIHTVYWNAVIKPNTTKTARVLLCVPLLPQSVCSWFTLECSWQHSGLAAWSCCRQRKSFCWSHCCALSSHPLHTIDQPMVEHRRFRRQPPHTWWWQLDDWTWGQKADGDIAIMQTVTCTSIEVVSSTTLFITARTFRGSMVLTQSRVSTLFRNIWEIIRPCTCKNKQEHIHICENKLFVEAFSCTHVKLLSECCWWKPTFT